MLKVIASDVVISKGYDGAPALRFSEKGVRFRVGKKVYDTRAENNQRWINLSVKAFGQTSERIKKMQLKEGSFVNILGRLDEDVWEDPRPTKKRVPRSSSWTRSNTALPANTQRTTLIPQSRRRLRIRRPLSLRHNLPRSRVTTSPAMSPSAAPILFLMSKLQAKVPTHK